MSKLPKNLIPLGCKHCVYRSSLSLYFDHVIFCDFARITRIYKKSSCSDFVFDTSFQLTFDFKDE